MLIFVTHVLQFESESIPFPPTTRPHLSHSQFEVSLFVIQLELIMTCIKYDESSRGAYCCSKYLSDEQLVFLDIEKYADIVQYEKSLVLASANQFLGFLSNDCKGEGCYRSVFLFNPLPRLRRKCRRQGDPETGLPELLHEYGRCLYR